MKKFMPIFLAAILTFTMLSFSVNAAYDTGNAIDEKASTLEGTTTADLAGLGWEAFSSGAIEVATEEGNSYVHFSGPKNQYSAPALNIFPAIKKISGEDDACVCIVLKLRFNSTDSSFEFATAGMVVRSNVESEFTKNSNGVYYARLDPIDSIDADCGEWITVIVEYVEISAEDLATEAKWQLTFDRLGPDGDEQAMQEAGAYESNFTIDIDDVAIYDADYYDEHIVESLEQNDDPAETEPTEEDPNEEAPKTEPTEVPEATQAPTASPTAVPTEFPGTAEGAENGNNTGVIVGIIIAAIVIAAGIIVFAVMKKKKSASDKND